MNSSNEQADPRLTRPMVERMWSAGGSLFVGCLAGYAYSNFYRQGYGSPVDDPAVVLVALAVAAAACVNCFKQLSRTGHFVDGASVMVQRLLLWGIFSAVVSAGLGMLVGTVFGGKLPAE